MFDCACTCLQNVRCLVEDQTFECQVALICEQKRTSQDGAPRRKCCQLVPHTSKSNFNRALLNHWSKDAGATPLHGKAKTPRYAMPMCITSSQAAAGATANSVRRKSLRPKAISSPRGSWRMRPSLRMLPPGNRLLIHVVPTPPFLLTPEFV